MEDREENEGRNPQISAVRVAAQDTDKMCGQKIEKMVTGTEEKKNK